MGGRHHRARDFPRQQKPTARIDVVEPIPFSCGAFQQQLPILTLPTSSNTVAVCTVIS
jgi:hypothetical protein